MTSAHAVFFTACALQGIGFAMLAAALGKERQDTSKAPLSEKDDGNAASGPIPVAACALLAVGALLMLAYAAWLTHLILFAGQLLFSLFMALTIRRRHIAARTAVRSGRE